MKATVRRYYALPEAFLISLRQPITSKSPKEPLAPIHCVVISDALAEILDAQLH